MPIYDYAAPTAGTTTEVIHGIDDAGPAVLPVVRRRGHDAQGASRRPRSCSRARAGPRRTARRASRRGRRPSSASTSSDSGGGATEGCRARRRAGRPALPRSSGDASEDGSGLERGLTMPPAATDWISLEEAAEILSAANVRFRPATIGGWARAGKVQSIKLGGRRFVRRGEIRALVARAAPGSRLRPPARPVRGAPRLSEVGPPGWLDGVRARLAARPRPARGRRACGGCSIATAPRRRAARRRACLCGPVRDRARGPAPRRRGRPVRGGSGGAGEVRRTSSSACVPPLHDLIQAVLDEAARDAAPVSIIGAVVLLWGTSRFAVAFQDAIARVMGGNAERGLLARNLGALGRRRPADRRRSSPARCSRACSRSWRRASPAGVMAVAERPDLARARAVAGRWRRSAAMILVYRVVPKPAPPWRAVDPARNRRRARADGRRARVRVPRAAADRRGGAGGHARDGIRGPCLARAVVPGNPARARRGCGTGRTRSRHRERSRSRPDPRQRAREISGRRRPAGACRTGGRTARWRRARGRSRRTRGRPAAGRAAVIAGRFAPIRRCGAPGVRPGRLERGRGRPRRPARRAAHRRRRRAAAARRPSGSARSQPAVRVADAATGSSSAGSAGSAATLAS